MRRAHIGWVGAGLVVLVGPFALGACGSKGTGGGLTTSASSGSGDAGASSASGTGGATTASASSAAGTGGATTGPSSSSASGAGGATGSAASSSSSSGNPAAGDSVLMHHKNLNRDGLYVQPTLTKAAVATLHKDPGFVTSGIQGAVYAQPLFVDGGVGGQDLVIVATEQNEVHALDAATGATVWVTSLGAPVPLVTLQTCGNIDPFGVTGTPVIDLASRTLFLDAEVIPSGGPPTHRVFGLSIDTGAVKPGWPVDMPTKAKSGATTFTSNVQGQRGALAVLDGTVYVPFGGRFGDCPTYHGWVVAISTADPTSVQSWATTAHAGGVWTPGGISSDGTSLFVSTGNTQSTTTWGGGDAVIRLAPGAPPTMSAYFAPKNWLALDNGDLDLGTTPIVFDLPGSTPSTLAIAFGKDGNAYLLDRGNLGGVGAALGAGPSCSTTGNCFSLHVATNEVISAPVLYTTATATYVATRGNGGACTSGSGDLLTVQVLPGSPPSLKAAWCAAGGAGSPMVTTSDGHADAIVWTLGAEGDGRLHAFDGDTGATIPFTNSTAMVPGMRRYNTPIAAKGRIFVPVDGPNGGVVAFKP